MKNKWKCDRCGATNTSLTMSFFNTDMICPCCEEKEHNHPDYERAKEIERAHVIAGDYNFIGVGKPADL